MFVSVVFVLVVLRKPFASSRPALLPDTVPTVKPGADVGRDRPAVSSLTPQILFAICGPHITDRTTLEVFKNMHIRSLPPC